MALLASTCNGGKLRNRTDSEAAGKDAGPAITLDAPAADGAEETCAEEAHETGLVPTDVLFLLDRSYWAEGIIPGTKDLTPWILGRQALLAFLRDPRSAGLNVALQFYPWASESPICKTDADCPGSIRDNCLPEKMCTGVRIVGCGQWDGAMHPEDCGTQGSVCRTGQCSLTGRDCYDTTKECPSGVPGDACQPMPRVCRGYSLFCDYEKYDKPNVDFSPLPEKIDVLSERLRHTPPAGLRYMGPAVAGSLKMFKARLAAASGPRRGVMVVVTDGGQPTINCLPPSITLVADLLAEAHTEQPSITTYVMGVGSEAELSKNAANLAELASKGGSKEAHVVKVQGTMEFVNQLQGALDEIRGRALPCEFTIPAMSSGPVDYQRVNFSLRGAGGETRVPYVANAAACDPARGGWYYDADPASADAGAVPTRVIACPSTCQALKSDPAAKVELRYGCKTRGIE